MRHSAKVLAVGAALLIGAIASDLLGSAMQQLSVLVLSLALAVAGAVLALRGMLEFVGERL